MYGGKGTAGLFLPITSNYKFTGFKILPDFGVFDIFKNPNVSGAMIEYEQHVAKYCL